MYKREEAKRTLKFYFRLLAEKSGMNWDSDNDAEIEASVDLIIDAAKEEQDLEEKRYGFNQNRK